MTKLLNYSQKNLSCLMLYLKKITIGAENLVPSLTMTATLINNLVLTPSLLSLGSNISNHKTK